MATRILLGVAALGPPALYLFSSGKVNVGGQDTAVTILLGLGLLFVGLSIYDVLASSPVARGPKRAKKWSALTTEVS